MRSVLFLCTGNSARSILAEAMLNRLGTGRFRACSAGSRPTGRINPLALELLQSQGFDTNALRSKNWDEFGHAGLTPFDLVITVCDNAAAEVCPVWPGKPAREHWSIADPAAVAGDDETKRKAFRVAAADLRSRIEELLRRYSP